MMEKQSRLSIHWPMAKTPEISLVQCGWQKCTPGYSYGPATRDHTLIHFVAYGGGTLYKKEGNFAVSAGECFTIYPGEATLYTALSDDPWEYYWVGFEGTLSDKLLKNTLLSENQTVFRMVERTDEVIRCIKEMYACAQLASGGSVKALGLLLQFLSYVVDSCPKDPKETLSPMQKEYLTRAIYYIQRNYSREFNVHALADYVGIDRSYLYRIFIEYFGVGPSRYITGLRIDEACRLLQETDLPVGQIAMDTGFSSASHMGEAFKSIKKISPRAYRHRYRDAAISGLEG